MATSDYTGSASEITPPARTLTPGYLKYPSGAHVIYFRDYSDRLEVVRILHGKQDVQRYLVQ